MRSAASPGASTLRMASRSAAEDSASVQNAPASAGIPLPVVARTFHHATADRGVIQVLAGVRAEALHPQAIPVDGLGVLPPSISAAVTG
jgi:hypothetical protein